jgi:hypothetical protein
MNILIFKPYLRDFPAACFIFITSQISYSLLNFPEFQGERRKHSKSEALCSNPGHQYQQSPYNLTYTLQPSYDPLSGLEQRAANHSLWTKSILPPGNIGLVI